MEADKLYALKGMKAPRKTKQASSKTDAAVIATKGSKDAKESSGSRQIEPNRQNPNVLFASH